MLQPAEQIEEINKRQQSSNYLNAPFQCNMCYKGFIDTVAWKHHVGKHDVVSMIYEIKLRPWNYVIINISTVGRSLFYGIDVPLLRLESVAILTGLSVYVCLYVSMYVNFSLYKKKKKQNTIEIFWDTSW